MRAGFLPLFFSVLGPLLSGCQAGYVWKQGWRQIAMSFRQVPLASRKIDKLLTEEQREKLAWVLPVLEFARNELALDPGGAYRTVLDVGDGPVSYVVVASHPLALALYRWCFPFTGCVPYKGYFDREDAEKQADRLREQGFDVLVSPVEGYSTLGWFQDPVLSTMLEKNVPELIDLLIHETVHRTLYVPGETKLNESLATQIAREGARLFLERYPEAAPREDVQAYIEGIERETRDEELLRRLRWDLESLYRSSLSEDEQGLRKAEIFATAGAARKLLFGPGAELPASNAYVLLSAGYHELIPALRRIQAREGGHPRDLMAYLKSTLEETGRLPEELRHR